jgi:acetoacetyl-CoA synthetase
MDVDVFDESAHQQRTQRGELVCKAPFPSMPVAFWNDPDGAKYRAAYFERFPGVWCHGDWTRKTAHGGFIIFGRSDATLNPGGVRIGTAEIYRQVEQLPEVIESLAVGQQWQGDERIILFVRLAEGASLDDALRKKSPDTIPQGHIAASRAGANHSGGRHPKDQEQQDCGNRGPPCDPRQGVSNREALANPAALDLFRDLPELRR